MTIPSGALAELWSTAYLQQQGLTLIEKNYRSRFGEIDLIMRDRKVLVFIEIRLRKNPAFGGAAASIDAHKQQRIIHTAQLYLATLKQIPACRFDVVLLDDTQGKNVQWLKNAFEA